MSDSGIIVLNMMDPNIKQQLATLPEKMLDYAEEVLVAQANVMKGLAQVYVDVDTGSLRDSIRIERGGIGQHWREVRVRAGGYITNPKTGKLVDYAIHVEARHPFMLPAWLEIADTVAEMIKANVAEKVQSEL
jgi:hypothetical protein